MRKEQETGKKPAIVGLKFSELEQILSDHADKAALPRFRAKQIYNWIIRGACDFNEMTDIPITLQNDLKDRFALFSSGISGRHNDDGAQKIVLTLNDGCKIESVLLNDGKERYTACLSTQAGCPAGCVFCKTGSVKFARNLDYTEITEQFFHLTHLRRKNEKDVRGQERGLNQSSARNLRQNSLRLIDNIVIMGMGEPFLNLDNLRKAISVFTDPKGVHFSPRRITVSTCGIAESLFDIAENGPFFRLALSLPTADETLRQKLMPITIKNPLEKIKKALILYQQKDGGRVTLEVPLLGGINTREADAASIAMFAKGLNTVVNIIPWNPVAGFMFDGKPLRQPDKKETADFTEMLKKQNLKVTTRLHKGRSVMGACGQLG